MSTTVSTSSEYRQLLVEFVESGTTDREQGLQAAEDAGFSEQEFDSHLERLREAHRAVKAAEEARAADEALGEFTRKYRDGEIPQHIYQARFADLRMQRKHAHEEVSSCRSRLADLCPSITRRLKEIQKQIQGHEDQGAVFGRERDAALVYHVTTDTGSKYRKTYLIADLREIVAEMTEEHKRRDETGSIPKVQPDERKELNNLQRRIRLWEEAESKIEASREQKAELESQAAELREQLSDWRNVEF